MARREGADGWPRIGVTGSAWRGRAMWAAAYFSLLLQGCWARRVTAPERKEQWRGLDGLLIGGGDDVSAELYGMAPTPGVRLDPARDALELSGLAHFWESGAPILGVCRGSQIMNIFKGGALHQDIYAVYESARPMRTVLPRKSVTLKKSRLRDIVKMDVLRVNALHHQSIALPGDGFVITSTDEHGVVQSIEHVDPPFRIGVQWHPEFLFYKLPHRRLFRAFAEAAREHRARRLSA